MRVVPNVIPRRSEAEHRALEMAQPLTPKSERSRASYGALGISLSNLSDGRCEASPKCFYPPNHPGNCAGTR